MNDSTGLSFAVSYGLGHASRSGRAPTAQPASRRELIPRDGCRWLRRHGGQRSCGCSNGCAVPNEPGGPAIGVSGRWGKRQSRCLGRARVFVESLERGVLDSGRAVVGPGRVGSHRHSRRQRAGARAYWHSSRQRPARDCHAGSGALPLHARAIPNTHRCERRQIYGLGVRPERLLVDRVERRRVDPRAHPIASRLGRR